MVMVSLKREAKVIIDTSALLTMCDGIDFFTPVEREFGNVKYIVPVSVVEELNKLAKQNLKYEKCLKLLTRIISSNRISVIATGNTKNYADDDLLNMDGDLFVTNDMELAKKLSEQSKKVFILKRNRYYDFY